MAIQTVKTGAAVNDGTGDDARTAFTKINQNFTDSANAASRQVGTGAGNVMEVGAFGLGTGDSNRVAPSLSSTELTTGFYSGVFDDRPSAMSDFGMAIHIANASAGKTHFGQMLMDLRLDNLYYRRTVGGTPFSWLKIYSTGNTTVDANGFIKNASPIVKLYADKIELNDEAAQQKITFEKLGVGDYLIKGSTGFAQEGWYIEMPKDANGNVLVAVVYEQLANKDISVKTYAKKFDEETGDVVANTAKPRDIPVTRWIDLRLQALPQPDITPADNTVTTNAE